MTISFYTRTNEDFAWTLETCVVKIDSLYLNPVLDDTLDSGRFTFTSTTRTSNILPYTQAKLVITETSTSNTLYFYASSEAVENVQTGVITHNVRLIEPTKILEKIQCEGVSFLQTLDDPTPYTIASAIERLNTIHKINTDNLDRDLFILDSSLTTYLESVRAPEFTFPSSLNLKEVLFKIGGFINGVPKLGGEDFNTLTFQFCDKQDGALTIPSGYYEKVVNQSDEDYCERTVGDYDNVCSDSGAANLMVYPYEDGYVTPTSKTVDISNDTASIIQLPTSIYKLEELHANYLPISSLSVAATLKGYNAADEYQVITGVTWGSDSDPAAFAISIGNVLALKTYITDKVLLKEDYDLLHAKNGTYDGVAVTVSKANRLFYEMGGTVIDGLNYTTQYIFKITGNRAIVNILNESISAPTGADALNFVTSNSLGTDTITDLREVVFTTFAGTVNSSLKIYELLFNVKYQTKSSGRLQTIKDNRSAYANTGKQLTALIGQATNEDNLQAVGRGNWAKTQRLGTKSRDYTIGVSNYSELPLLNTYSSGYVLTSMDIQFLGNNFITAKLYTDYGYNRFSEYAQIERNIVTWEKIKNRYIQRRTLNNEYVYVGSVRSYDDDESEVSSVLKDDITGIFGYAYENTVGGYETSREVTFGYFRSVDNAIANLQVDSVAYQKSIKMTIATKDNVSAGQYSSEIDGTASYRAIRQHQYTDQYGKADGIEIEYFNRGQPFDSKSQANRILHGQTAIKVSANSYGQYVYKYSNLNYLKSAGEAVEITTQFHFIPTSSNYIVGYGLADTNPIIQSFTTAPPLYLYYIVERLSSNAVNALKYTHSLQSSTARTLITKTIDTVTIIPAEGDQYNTTVATMTIALPTVGGAAFGTQTTYQSWVLTDASGNIIVGANKPSATSAIFNIAFSFTNKLA